MHIFPIVPPIWPRRAAVAARPRRRGDRISPSIAASAHGRFWHEADLARRLPVCPLLGVKRTFSTPRHEVCCLLLTHSGHWPDLNPAVQRSPTIGYLGKIQNNSGLSQGLCGRTARHSCYGVNSQNRSSRREREHGSSLGLFEFKERRALVLLRRGSAHGRFRTRRRRPQSAR
jgi:hypothetical protein